MPILPLNAVKTKNTNQIVSVSIEYSANMRTRKKEIAIFKKFGWTIWVLEILIPDTQFDCLFCPLHVP